MSLLKTIKKSAKAVKGLSKTPLGKAAIVAGATAVAGPGGGATAGAVLKATGKSGKKQKKAKASVAAASSAGSTDIALRDGPGDGSSKKGFLASLLAIFGL